MNYRLKNRQVFTPVGFQFMQPEMSWDSTKAVPGATLSGIARAVQQLRQANPHLTQKHNLSTDYATICDEVDEYTAAVCVSVGAMNFVQGDSPPKTSAFRSGASRFAAAAGGVKRFAAGVGVLLSWLGSGGRPVEPQLAERRAVTCADCPQNGPGDWKARFTGSAAQEIQQQLGIKNDLKLATAKDDVLQVCNACDCVLKLKVWCPLEHILKGTTPEIKARLDPRCWILSEQ
jgi:hypothetical protein